jgi:hypothetical protein
MRHSLLCGCAVIALLSMALCAWSAPDPIWAPSELQVRTWVMYGVEAAAAEESISSLPAVSKWVWVDRSGLDMGRGQKLRFVIAGTPEFTATGIGYLAAWQPEIWERLQTDRDGTINSIAASVKGSVGRGYLLLMFGIYGQPDRSDGSDYSPRLAIYRSNQWVDAGSLDAGPLLMAMDNLESTRIEQWGSTTVGLYVLDDLGFRPEPSQYEHSLLSTVQWTPGGKVSVRGFLSTPEVLPTPANAGPDDVRIVVGSPQQFAYVDLTLR